MHGDSWRNSEINYYNLDLAKFMNTKIQHIIEAEGVNV